MSMLITSNDNILTLKEYVLEEAIKPKETSLGNNLEADNNEFTKKDENIFTFFKDSEKSYALALKNGNEVVFASKEGEISTDIRDYSISRKDTYNTVTVFNKVFYVLLKLLEKFDIDYVEFDAANPALGVVYDMIAKNKFFLRELKNVGFEYTGKFDNTHTFKKRNE